MTEEIIKEFNIQEVITSPPIGVNEIILKYMIRKAKEHEQRTSEIFYVTDLTRCPRKVYYELKYPEVVRTVILNSKIRRGVISEKGKIDILKEELGDIYEIISDPEKLTVEKKFYVDGQEIKVRGRMDCLVRNKITGEEIIIEMKETDSSSFGWPHQNHVEQLMIYLNLYPKAIRGELTYDGPDRGTDFGVTQKMSDEEIIRRLRNLLKIYTEAGPEGPLHEWECEKFCDWNQICPYRVFTKWRK